MNKLAAIIGIVLVLGLGGYVAFGRSQSNKVVTAPELKKPWVEVLSSRVSLWNTSTNTETRELKTGDEVGVGSTLHVDTNGLANIYFPNGSVVRLDKDTTLTITEASYDSSNDSVAVKLSLSLGRVWSKVVSLVTPDSVWEVETANTVVTVRGTAFGVQVAKNGKSTVVGSEGKVAAKKKNQTEEVFVTADTFLTVEKAATTTEKLVLKVFNDEISHDEWVKINRVEDKKIETRVEALRAGGKTETEVREQFRLELQEKFRAEVETRREEIKADEVITPGIKPETKTDVEVKTPAVTPKKVIPKVETKIEVKPQVTTSLSVKSIEIAKPARDVLKEGDVMSLRANAVLSDGTLRDISSEVVWKVVGPIGSIPRAGSFAAKLSGDSIEVGTGKGFIVVTWKDAKSGEEFLAQTTVITVNATITDSGEQAI